MPLDNDPNAVAANNAPNVGTPAIDVTPEDPMTMCPFGMYLENGECVTYCRKGYIRNGAGCKEDPDAVYIDQGDLRIAFQGTHERLELALLNITAQDVLNHIKVLRVPNGPYASMLPDGTLVMASVDPFKQAVREAGVTQEWLSRARTFTATHQITVEEEKMLDDFNAAVDALDVKPILPVLSLPLPCDTLKRGTTVKDAADLLIETYRKGVLLDKGVVLVSAMGGPKQGSLALYGKEPLRMVVVEDFVSEEEMHSVETLIAATERDDVQEFYYCNMLSSVNGRSGHDLRAQTTAVNFIFSHNKKITRTYLMYVLQICG